MKYEYTEYNIVTEDDFVTTHWLVDLSYEKEKPEMYEGERKRRKRRRVATNIAVTKIRAIIFFPMDVNDGTDFHSYGLKDEQELLVERFNRKLSGAMLDEIREMLTNHFHDYVQEGVE